MGYLACPVCERESLANVSDLQLRVATALTRLLTCPICSASVSGLQAFHHHLGAHLHPQHNSCSSPGTPPSASGVISYPAVSSPETIPTLEHLDISDGGDCVSSPSRAKGEAAASSDCSIAQPHNCDLCGLVFSSEHFLKIHKDIIHSKSGFFDVTCKLCRKKFKDFDAYRNHVREEHSERRYICEQCPKTFKMKGSLLVHTRMFHDPSSPGTCHVCNKTFTTRARRELHEKRYHGLGSERMSPGKASPPFTSTKHQKNRNSTLGDAKNWLETLMNENKAIEECRGASEASDQHQHQHHHLPQPPPPPLSPVPHFTPHIVKQHQPDPSMASEDQSGQHFMGQQPQQSPHLRLEQVEAKEYHHHHHHHHHQQQLRHIQQSPLEPNHHPAKTPTKESEDQHTWSQEMQPYAGFQDKSPLQQKSPSDFYLAQYKTNIVFPCQVPSQNHGRPRLCEYSEMKEEKDVPMPPYTSAPENTAASRVVGGGHTQSSPVAVVSPQPHKAETPPANNQHSHDATHAHTESRRNSFPLASFNKLQSPPRSDHAARQTSTSYVSELSLNTAEEGGGGGGGGVNGTPLGLVYQNIMPNLAPQALIDHKSGLRVPPLLLPATLCQSEKKGHGADTTTQLAETQKGVSTCEVRPLVPGEGQQEAARPSQTTATTTKKESRATDNNKQWECDVCKKCFTTKYFLKKHKRLHTGETPYACAECGKTFTFQQSYHKHVLYHSDDKPHQCSYCGRSFKEMSTLHNHVRIHTGEKPFVCETCGKAFRQRVSYLVHQRIHTGVMPYTCEVCNRSFRYKVSLRSHKCEPRLAASSSSSKESSDTAHNSPAQSAPPTPAAVPPTQPAFPATTQTTVEMAPAGCVGSSQQVLTPAAVRGRLPLETIDATAICEGVAPQEEKRTPHRARGGRGSGGVGAHDPLSMAFLHALADPQPGRPQSTQDPSLPFPSLSPGAIDADMDHDSFLTHLLM